MYTQWYMEILVLDGKTYVKASKAAKDLGYATDYVGQLCRNDQIDAHLIGRTWYVTKAIQSAKRLAPSLLKIEVEVTTFDQLKEALAEDPDVILLDNFDLDGIKKCVEITRASNKKVLLEVSGGVTLARVPELAATGVDFLSAGALTHSAPAADLSLELSLL